jgi:hypothetical protein
MKKCLVISGLTASLLLSGCVISVHDDDVSGSYSASWKDREENNRKHISTLNVGNSLESVTSKMGVADFDELKSSSEGQVRILYYRTQSLKDDGVTTKEECTPIVFVNNELTGWGEAALDQI